MKDKQTIKDKVIESIKKLPDDANYNEIMESIYVQQMITKGIDQLDKREFISHENVKLIVGGAPLNEERAKKFGADDFAEDAVENVKHIKQLIE